MADEQSAPTHYERLMQEREQREQMKKDVNADLQIYQSEVVPAAERDSEERRGLFLDTGVGAARAVPGFFEESFDFLASIDEAAMRTFGTLDLNPFDGDGFQYHTPEENRLRIEAGGRSPIRTPEDGWRLIKEQLPEVDRWTGGFAEAGVKFALGFFTGRAALTGVGALQGATRTQVVANAMASGAIADTLAFDGHEARLSDLIQATEAEGGFPDISNAVTEFLASDPNDSELEGRLKNAIEGAGLGVITDSIMLGFKAYRQMRFDRAVREASDTVDNTVDDAFGDMDLTDAGRAADEADADAAALEVVNRTDPDLLEVDVDANSTLIFRKRDELRPDGEELDVQLGRDEAGKIEAMERGGETLQIINSAVEPGLRGTGAGRELYEAMARQADERGLRLTSDTSVSEDAAAVWERMARDGHEIIDNRTSGNVEEVVSNGRTTYQTTDGRPVFERVRGPEPQPARQADEGAAAADEVAVAEARRQTTQTTVDLTPEQTAALREAIEANDIEGIEKALNDFNVEKIDWDSIEDGDGIYAVLRATEEVMAPIIDNAKGGVQTVTVMNRLADMVGATAEQVKYLHDDVRGSNGLAVRFTAARRTLLASARELKRRAVAVRDAATDAERAAAEVAYMRQAQLHTGIQARIKGTQTEIARSLRMMRETNSQIAAEFHELDQIRAQFGGGGSRAFNDHLNRLIEMGDISQINRHVRETFGQKFKNAVVEYVINSMLSSFKTHAINITSNVLNTALYTADRVLMNTARGILGNQAAWREARIELAHKVIEIPAAFKTAIQAFREGLPVSDMRQRLEFENRKAINADLFGLSDASLAGRLVNAVGTVIRLPGRALITGDEFFKTWNRNTELHVQAFRRADEEAASRGFQIGTDPYESFVSARTRQLLDPENNSNAAVRVRDAARERARLATFQESGITPVGPAFERAFNSSATLKLVVAPFFRTPMNILRQGVLDRTLLGLTLKHHREAIAAGGPDAAEAFVRMTTGTTAMATMWFAMDSLDEDSPFEIVGKIPYDSIRRASGVRDYSIRIGDEWYQYNRLDPLGLWIGMIADARQIAEAGDEESATVFMQAALGAFMGNVTNKTWAASVADLVEMAERSSSANALTVRNTFNRFVAGEIGKFIPQFLKSTRDLEGERSAVEAWEIGDILASQVPILNEDLPPRHDALGRPITWESGFGSMVSPFQNSKLDSELDRVLYDLDFTMRPMRKTIGGVELTAEEYSRMTGYVSLDGGLESTLEDIIISTSFRNSPPGVQTLIIKKTIQKAREAARQMMLQDPEFVKKMTDADLSALNDFLSP